MATDLPVSEKGGAAESGDAMRHVRALAERIGPRPSTGAGEASAAQYVAAEMKRWADVVRSEPFTSFTSFSWPWMLIYGAGVLAAALLWFRPLLALPVAALALWAFWRQAEGRLELGYLFPRRPSQNAVGILKARQVRRQRVVLVAHVDSARSSLVWSPGQVRAFRATFLLSVAAAWLLLLLAVLACFGALAPRLGLAWPDARLWAAAAVLPGADLLLSLLVLVHRELFCTVTPGANDNASGVAAALAACEQLAAEPLQHTELWCVGSGCEEVGMTGMRALLAAHRAELAGAYFIVLDNLGKGQLKYTTGEGLLTVHPCDHGLVRLAAGIARHHPEWNLGTSVNRLLPTDMGPALLQGYRAIGLRAEDEHGLLPNWHWRTDVVENVNPANVATAAACVVALARALDVQV